MLFRSAPPGGGVEVACAITLADGVTGLADPRTRGAPPGERYPHVLVGRQQFARVSLDLRTVREVGRLLIVAVSSTRAPIPWGGTLLLATHSGDRIEIPLDPVGTAPVAAVASLHQVEGELVVRAELRAAATVREACEAFGYEALTWLDAWTPLG